MTKVINLRRYTRPNLSKRKKEYSRESIKEEKYKIILLLISIISIIIGCFIYKYNNQYTFESLNNFISMNKTYSFLSTFFYLIRFDLCFLILVFFIGTSFVGKFFVSIPIVLKSLIIGYISSYIYNEFKINGIMFCLIILYPYLAITISTLIFAANEGIYMCNSISNIINHKNTANDISIKLYFMRYAILLLINIVCTVANSLIITFILPKITIL